MALTCAGFSMQVASLKVTPGLKKRIKEVTLSSEGSVLLITYSQRVPLLNKSPLEKQVFSSKTCLSFNASPSLDPDAFRLFFWGAICVTSIAFRSCWITEFPFFGQLEHLESG